MSTLTRIWQRILAWLNNLTLDPVPTPKPPVDAPVDDDPPVIVVPPAPAPAAYHATDWWRNAIVRGMNILDPSMPAELRKQIFDWRRDDTFVPVYLANDGDGNYGHTSMYKAGVHGGEVDRLRVNWMRDELQKYRARGQRIDFWLMADDSKRISKLPETVQMRYINNAVGAFGDLAAQWCLCLEAQETWPDKGMQKRLIAHLKTLTNQPAFIHYWSYKDWQMAVDAGADGFHAQYGFGLTPATIRAQTLDAAPKVHAAGLRYIAFEYGKDNESDADKARGRAAMEAGADGTGSGCS